MDWKERFEYSGSGVPRTVRKVIKKYKGVLNVNERSQGFS